MLKTNVTTNIYGQSIIVDSGNQERQVAYMNATINENNSVNFNKSIQDMALYKENKTAVDADFKEFEDKVYALSDSMKA